MLVPLKWLAVGFIVLAAILCPSQAHASYIDPGSGSIILQAVLAAIFGAAVTLRHFWARIKLALFGAPKKTEFKKEDPR